MENPLFLGRRRFLRNALAGGLATWAAPRLLAETRASEGGTPIAAGTTPPPLFSYPAGDPAILVLHPSAHPVTFEGRQGLHFTSIRGRAGLPRHTVGARKGSLTLWVLPMQEIAPQAHYPAHMESNPASNLFPFLSDREAVEDIEAANFCLWEASDWYPGLMVKFMSGPPTGDAGYIRTLSVATTNAFEFLAERWYQLAVTWDRDRGDYRIYANGVLVAASDVFAEGKPVEEPPAPTLFFGNPGYAMGQVDFFDRVLTPAEVGRLFVKGGGRTDTEVQAALEKRHAGKGLAAFSGPESAAGWVKRKSLSLCDPAQDAEFFHQGCGPCLRYTGEGLRITTPGMAEFAKTHGHTKYDMTRMYLWTREMFQGDLHVTAEFKIHRHGGLALWMLQAAGMQGEDFLNDYPLRSDGSMRVVCWEDVRNYHWEFYREMIDTRNDLVSHALIKNPWFNPLAFQMENRRWDLDRWYRVTFLQEKNRLRGAIDGTQIFDVADDGLSNNGPVMRQGRVALRLMMRSDMTFRNLEISDRSPFS